MRLGLGSKDWIDPVLIMDPLSFSAAGSPLVGPLEGGIVYKDVDGAERIDGFPGHSLGYGMLANVAGEEDGFATDFGNETLGLPGIRLFE
jgi:hypothetical protein